MVYVLKVPKDEEDEKQKKKKKRKENWKKVGKIGKKVLDGSLKAGEVVAKTSMKVGEGMMNYMDDRFGDEDERIKPKKKPATKKVAKKTKKTTKKVAKKMKKKRVIIEYE
jgi:hypothetical protein